MRWSMRFGARAGAVVGVCAALAASTWSHAQVVVSQIWGGGNNVSTSPNADCVELFNRSGSAVSVAGWSVQVASATGAVWRVVNLSGSIPARSYYLVRVEPAGALGTPITPDADFVGTGTSALSSGSGKVALRNNTTALAVANPLPDATIIDFVGYGTTASASETSPAPGGTTVAPGTGIVRRLSGCQDTNSNSADFVTITPPAMRNSASPALGNEIPVGSATPASTAQGTSSLLSVVVRDCDGNELVASSVSGNLAAFGGSNPQAFTNSSGNTWTFNLSIPLSQGIASYSIPVSAVVGANTVPGTITLGVTAAPPANDLCTSAIMMMVGTDYIGNNSAATSTGDGPAPSCQSSFGKSVWYTFVPPATSGYEITACGSPQDTVITVFSGYDCVLATGTQVACDDDTCAGGEPGPGPGTGSALASIIAAAPLNGGQTYHIRLSSFGATPAGNSFKLRINTTTSGACCLTAGGCTITTPSTCTAGTYQGDTTTCTPSPCPAFGACCNLTAFSCAAVFATNCLAPNTFQGNGTTCTPTPCPPRPNDDCTGAVALTGDGVRAHANTGSTTGSLAPTCGVINQDVWYKWTAPASGTLRFTTMNGGSDRNAIYDGGAGAGTCPTSATDVSCATTGAWTEATVVAGNTYFMQTGQVATGTGVLQGLDLWLLRSAVGSCCVGTACTIVSQNECMGTFTAGGLCNPDTATVNSYVGTAATVVDFTTTAGGTIVSSTLAVADSFTVSDVEVDITGTHTYVGDLVVSLEKDGRVIELFSRPQRITASVLGSSSNLSASVLTFSDTGSDSLHAALVALATQPTDVPAGTYRAATTGGLNLSFKNTFNGVSASGNWILKVSDWAGVDVGTVSWTLRLKQGGPTNCSAAATGRCCVGSRCVVGIDSTACDALAVAPAGRVFTASATNCNATGTFNTPCCFADYNKVGGIGVQDIFDFLTGWFSNSPNANVQGDGTAPGVQDIFDFLSAWFGGGC